MTSMPLSGVDDGRLARCQTNSDCVLEGYSCVPFEASRYANDVTYDDYKGATVCDHTYATMRDCVPDAGLDGKTLDIRTGARTPPIRRSDSSITWCGGHPRTRPSTSRIPR
ncbi:hypothetical protein [Sorangium sp. So ce341]|uniref:hypothetical protein n=1 Tax=Sorangium sp. So ce341 TaxID=3133302 RepID=UPI003F5F3DD4